VDAREIGSMSVEILLVIPAVVDWRMLVRPTLDAKLEALIPRIVLAKYSTSSDVLTLLRIPAMLDWRVSVEMYPADPSPTTVLCR
jgi:hypothetical protein